MTINPTRSSEAIRIEALRSDLAVYFMRDSRQLAAFQADLAGSENMPAAEHLALLRYWHAALITKP